MTVLMRKDYRNELLNSVDPEGASQRDSLYSNPLEHVPPFDFNEGVVRVFPDMIERSVPSYWYLTEMTGVLSRKHYSKGTNAYDLGCSLGSASFAMHHHLEGLAPNIIAVDKSEAMINRLRSNTFVKAMHPALTLRHGDIMKCTLENASVVVLNFTLQFISPDERDALIRNVYNGLNRGGALILSEKILLDRESENQTIHEIHQHFKRACGYTQLEVDQKNSAIKNVMPIDSRDRHFRRLKAAGFSSVTQWMQCLNFVSIIAEK
jgi:tRNA (cmo5U34)-methyltransferase